MNHLFCHGCGNKLSYSLAKPNFCGKCGQKLGMSATANIDSEKSAVLEQDETDVSSVPHIDDFQIEYDMEQASVTLGSLLGAQVAPDYKKRRRSLSVDEFIDEKKKER